MAKKRTSNATGKPVPKWAADVDWKTLTPVEQLNRVVFLCDVLQGYPDSAARLTDAKRALEGARRLYAVGALSSEDRPAQIEKLQAMVGRCEAASDKWVELLNEFFELANRHKLDIYRPSFTATRSKRRMPHGLDSFDWPAFVEDLLRVRDEAVRRAAELTERPAKGADTSKNTEIVPTSRDTLTQDLLNHQFNERMSGKSVEVINREFFDKNKKRLGKSDAERAKEFNRVKRNARRCQART